MAEFLAERGFCDEREAYHVALDIAYIQFDFGVEHDN